MERRKQDFDQGRVATCTPLSGLRTLNSTNYIQVSKFQYQVNFVSLAISSHTAQCIVYYVVY